MIVVNNVRKSFPIAYGFLAPIKYRGKVPRKEVLHGVSFTVERGELFGLLGPNGAGKTTLLKMLCTLTTPDAGTITIDGLDATKSPNAVKQRIGLCSSEERSFYFRLTARENLEFFGALVGLRGKTLAKRIEEVVEFVDLASAIDTRFSGFSSGMRQRLTLARSLLADPPILFLDEPTRAVDPVHAEELRTLIREELVNRRGKTVIMATNLLEEAWKMCDRLAIMRRGTIAACGPPKELDASYARLLRYQITVDRADDAFVARTRAVPGVTTVELTPFVGGVIMDVEIEPTPTSVTELLRAVSSNGANVHEIRFEEPRPMEVFTDLTQAQATDTDE
jgi:ABC-2 type transport system ATP-binding protein